MPSSDSFRSAKANLGVTENRQNRDVKCKAAKAPEKTACFFSARREGLADETFYLALRTLVVAIISSGRDVIGSGDMSTMVLVIKHDETEALHVKLYNNSDCS